MFACLICSRIHEPSKHFEIEPQQNGLATGSINKKLAETRTKCAERASEGGKENTIDTYRAKNIQIKKSETKKNQHQIFDKSPHSHRKHSSACAINNSVCIILVSGCLQLGKKRANMQRIWAFAWVLRWKCLFSLRLTAIHSVQSEKRWYLDRKAWEKRQRCVLVHLMCRAQRFRYLRVVVLVVSHVKRQQTDNPPINSAELVVEKVEIELSWYPPLANMESRYESLGFATFTCHVWSVRGLELRKLIRKSLRLYAIHYVVVLLVSGNFQ